MYVIINNVGDSQEWEVIPFVFKTKQTQSQFLHFSQTRLFFTSPKGLYISHMAAGFSSPHLGSLPHFPTLIIKRKLEGSPPSHFSSTPKKENQRNGNNNQ